MSSEATWFGIFPGARSMTQRWNALVMNLQSVGRRKRPGSPLTAPHMKRQRREEQEQELVFNLEEPEAVASVLGSQTEGGDTCPPPSGMSEDYVPGGVDVDGNALDQEREHGPKAFTVEIRQRSHLAQRMHMWPCISIRAAQLVRDAPMLDQRSVASYGQSHASSAVLSVGQPSKSEPIPEGDTANHEAGFAVGMEHTDGPPPSRGDVGERLHTGLQIIHDSTPQLSSSEHGPRRTPSSSSQSSLYPIALPPRDGASPRSIDANAVNAGPESSTTNHPPVSPCAAQEGSASPVALLAETATETGGTAFSRPTSDRERGVEAQVLLDTPLSYCSPLTAIMSLKPPSYTDWVDGRVTPEDAESLTSPTVVPVNSGMPELAIEAAHTAVLDSDDALQGELSSRSYDAIFRDGMAEGSISLNRFSPALPDSTDDPSTSPVAARESSTGLLSEPGTDTTGTTLSHPPSGPGRDVMAQQLLDVPLGVASPSISAAVLSLTPPPYTASVGDVAAVPAYLDGYPSAPAAQTDYDTSEPTRGFSQGVDIRSALSMQAAMDASPSRPDVTEGSMDIDILSSAYGDVTDDPSTSPIAGQEPSACFGTDTVT
ncbi:hypothetical protein FOMPIDRAFT_1056483, partial [Fomitopsis schrenkii]